MEIQDTSNKRNRAIGQFMREKAEQLAKEKIEASTQLPGFDRDKLLQELHIHQIELELQNEELRQSQERLAYTHQQYLDLYNEAPVGYASLDDTGLIVRANQRLAYMLGVERHILTGRALVEFMLPEDQPIFRGRFNAFVNQPEGKFIDVHFRMGEDKKKKDDSFVGRIQGKRFVVEETEEKKNFWEETLLVVISDVTELKASEAKVHFQAYHDSLTGLPNRTMLYERLETALSLAKRQHTYGALLFMDLDRFKNINDSLGHHIGDGVLTEFTERLRTHIRREDLLIRMGGDEFVVLLAEQHANKQITAVSAQKFAEHLSEALVDPLVVEPHQFQITLSMGISVFPFHAEDSVDDVVRQADTAMYQAKGDGRGQVRFFHANMQEAARQRMTLEAELHVALMEKQFELCYQPQFNCDGGIHAVEALVRWRHPYRGLVHPEKFIHVAEDTGMIVPLGEWIFEAVVRQIAEWRSKGIGADLQISINVSARQLESGTLTTLVEELLEKYDIEPECLVFEITESLLLPDDPYANRTIKRLSDIGLTFSIDDFGTGYSSLAVIQTAPIGQLKIDKRFVQELSYDDSLETEQEHNKQQALVDAVISLGRSLNLEVVAEGVETEVQKRVLELLGCQYMQGNFFSKPLPAEEVSELLGKA